ncbi:MAG: tetratricopeptide repeat protein [Myxococcales bacterium]|nr:tetratricopeptide repeat protein [Myxococcales bacterium]
MSSASLFRNVALSLGLVLALGQANAPAFAADDEDPEAFDIESRTGKGIKLRKMEEVDLQSEYQRLAEQKRLESIDRLKALLAKGVADETKAEMMLRLADLYFEQGRYLYLKEMEVFDRRYEACFNSDTCNPEALQPDNSGSEEWQEKSIKLYQGILRSYPRYARADQATFYLGSALKDLGREDQAVEAFKQLVKVYPDSDFLPDAYVLIGEYYFDVKANAFGALKAYQKAATFTDSPKYSYSMYKLGWCYYNVGDYEKAIETMKTVVSYSMQQTEQTTTTLQLQDEALRDLVRFFADADAMNEAIEYFTKLGRDDLIRSTLKKLAAMFFEQGKFDRSVEMYRRLILDAPSAKDNPEYQVEIINAYKKMGQRDKVLEEINRLRADYGPDSAWARSNANEPEAVADAQEKIEQQLRRIATQYHDTGRQYEKSRRVDDAMKVFELAKNAYQTYLELFPNNEHAYDVHYAYGELLYKLKDYAGAYEEYMTVVKLDPKGKHSLFCAESAVFAAEEQVKLEGGADASGKVTARKANITKETQPEELSLWEQRFVDACLQYAELYPQEKKVKDMIYKSAYLLYNKYQFDNAARQFQAVIAMDPRSREAEYGAQLILDALVVKESWSALKSTSKAFFDQQGLGGKEFKKDAYNIYQRSSFRLIEVTLDKDQDFGKAGDSFMGFYEEFPEADTAAQALNNSAFYYSKVGRVADSVKVRHILVEDPKFGPKTKYYYEQIKSLGFNYEQIADYDRASFYYEKLWTLFPEESKKKENKDKVDEMRTNAGDAIYTAAVFRKGLGEWEKSIDNYNQFIAAYPDDERIPDIKIRIGKIYEENERWEDAANIYQEFYTRTPKGASVEAVYFSRLHHGQAMDKLGNVRKRNDIYNDTIRLYERYVKDGGAPGPQTEFVAEMMFIKALPSLDSYLELEIKGLGKGASKKREDKALVDSLGKKAKTLVDVEGTFAEVVELGAGEWGLAALVALGKSYDNMASTLRGGATPYYLTEEQLEIYMMQIEDRAYVQEEKAVNAFRLALDKSYELTLYNENTAYATRRLGELRPDEYSGLSEQLLDPRWTSSKSGKQFDFETSL